MSIVSNAAIALLRMVVPLRNSRDLPTQCCKRWDTLEG
jgi:hypothetical protein